LFHIARGGIMAAGNETDMVNIHHREPMNPVPDAEALGLFEKQWRLYRKFVENDYGGHAGAARALHELLTATFQRPFAILDLGCGDATSIVSALDGTAVAHYHGVDMATPALDLAASNLDQLECEIELEHGDYVEAMRERPEHADVVWIGLSLHHFEAPGKRELMGEIRQAVGPGGMFVTYEPTSLPGESRAAYLDRYEAIGRDDWTALTAKDFKHLMDHVRSADFPESTSGWQALGEAAGFTAFDTLYRNDTNLFHMFRFGA
jgi:SAM-dependent methyltransferase